MDPASARRPGEGPHRLEPPHEHRAAPQDALDFINTLELHRGTWVDQIPDLPSALIWLQVHNLLHVEALQAELAAAATEPQEADHVLRRMRALRGAMRELVDSTVQRRAPALDQLAEINRVLRTRFVYLLVPARDGVSLDHRHEGDAVNGAMARLAVTLVQELTHSRAGRLRVCVNENCQFVFHDTSRTGQRKWCDMATCGNRAKAAGYRRRARNGATNLDGNSQALPPSAALS